ncbi:IS3 family transposase, partial [Klebsiella oxytoca]
EEKDKESYELIEKAYRFKNRNKGARGIKMTLERQYGIIMNVKKIRRLMHKYNLKCPIRKANPYRRMAKALKTN